MRKIKYKWEAMVVVIVALVCILPGSTWATNKEIIEKGADELDQHQEIAVENVFLPVGRLTIPDIVDLNFQIAQSFIPQKAILTRIEVNIIKNTTASNPFILGIRDELTHPDLVNTSVSADDIPTDNFSWVEFDISNLWVTVGQTYYLVCYTKNITDNFYGWAANNDSEAYPNGCAWISTDDGDTWSNDSVDLELNNNQHPNPKEEDNATWDMVFRTYGIDATSLVIEFQPSLLRPKFWIKNVGSVSAYDVEVSAQITGGFFHQINSSFSTNASELPANAGVMLMVGPLFGFGGFGPVTIKVMTWALNAEETETEVSGFLLFIFWIISAG
ncbi:MAG: hypothetical protein JW771_05020 [Candidatus Thermoplasmatota archaeon]|nr:hypothetical protein [Candidatus Thermoplasmatota archaeon]